MARSRHPMRIRGVTRFRRGGSSLAMVLCLFLALGSVLLGAVTLAATSNSAADRDYRRSQALALAEAGLVEARSGGKPHGPQPLGEGLYAWSSQPGNGGRLIIARGEVDSVQGVRVTRTVRALLAGGRIRAWEEGP